MYRLCIGPISALYRLCTGPISILYRPYIDPTSALYRFCIGYMSALCRPYIGTISALYRRVHEDVVGADAHDDEHAELVEHRERSDPADQGIPARMQQMCRRRRRCQSGHTRVPSRHACGTRAVRKDGTIWSRVAPTHAAITVHMR